MRYNDKLKHPLWQKKRLKIMERDGFMCVICGKPSIRTPRASLLLR